MTLHLVDEAAADIQEARRWYRRQRSELANRFIAAVASRLRAIEVYPEAQPRVHGSLRRVLLHRFPYALLYIIDEEAIVVIGCFHTARDPSAWQDRSDRYLREAE